MMLWPDALATITLLVPVNADSASLSVVCVAVRLVSGTLKTSRARARSHHLCTCLRELSKSVLSVTEWKQEVA